MILYMYIALRQGLTTPWGQNFDDNRNILSLWLFVASFKKISLVWFYTIFFFFMILYIYIAPGQGQTAPRGQGFDVNRNVLSLHSHGEKSLRSRANNSKVNNLIWPKSELVWAFMPVLVALCLFSLPASLTKIQLKESEKSWRHHFFHCSMARNSKMTGQIWLKFKLVQDLCLSLFPVSLMKTEFTVTEKKQRQHFPHSNSMGTLTGE